MANRYSYYQLRVACQQHMMASIYAEVDAPEEFNAGYVEAVTQRHVLLWSVTPWGQPDGWVLRRTEEVLQVFMGDDFEVRLQMLLEMGGSMPTPLLNPPPGPEEDLLRRVLQWAEEQGEIISIMTAEDTYTGSITQLDDLRMSMNLLDFFGAEDGQKQFPLREIQIVTLCTQEEHMYKQLKEERLKLL